MPMAFQIVLALVAFAVSIRFGRKAGTARYWNTRYMVISVVAILFPTYLLAQASLEALGWTLPQYGFFLVIITGFVFATPWFARDDAKKDEERKREENERAAAENARQLRISRGTHY